MHATLQLSLLAKWLAGKTPLKKPNHGERIVSSKPRPKVVYDFLGLVIVSLFYYVSVVSPALRDIFHTPMAPYNLFMLKVPLNTSHLTNNWLQCRHLYRCVMTDYNAVTCTGVWWLSAVPSPVQVCDDWLQCRHLYRCVMTVYNAVTCTGVWWLSTMPSPVQVCDHWLQCRHLYRCVMTVCNAVTCTGVWRLSDTAERDRCNLRALVVWEARQHDILSQDEGSVSVA